MITKILLASLIVINFQAKAQIIEGLYNDVVQLRNELGSFDKIFDTDSSKVLLKYCGSYKKGIYKDCISSSNSKEIFFFGPKNGYWFLIESYSLDQDMEIKLDSLNKAMRIFCIKASNSKFIFMAQILHRSPERLLFINEIGGVAYGSNSELIKFFPNEAHKLSFEFLVSIAMKYPDKWALNELNPINRLSKEFIKKIKITEYLSTF